MIDEERLKKVCDDFSSLNDDQQDYILGILQAMVFAKNTADRPEFDASSSDASSKVKS